MRRKPKFCAWIVFCITFSRSALAGTPKVCFCDAKPSVSDGVKIGAVTFYAKSPRNLAYVTDPACSYKSIQIRIDHGPLLPCDLGDAICPVPELDEPKTQLLEIRCEGTPGRGWYSLSGSELAQVDRTPPTIEVVKGPNENESLSGGLVALSGRALDGPGAGVKLINAEFESADPDRPDAVLRETFSVQPECGNYRSYCNWKLAHDFGRSGRKRVTARLWATDAVGNSGRGNPIRRTFLVNIPASIVIISTPANGQAVEVFAGIEGSAEDPWGLRGIDVSVREWSTSRYWDGNSFTSTFPFTAARIAVAGTQARWSYGGLPQAALRHRETYVVTARGSDNKGLAFPTTEIKFSYRDSQLAIIEDEHQTPEAALHAVEAIARRTPLSKRSIDALISATFDHDDRVSYAAAAALARAGRPALPEIIHYLPNGDGTQVRYLAWALGIMPPELQKEALEDLVRYARSTNIAERSAGLVALGSLKACASAVVPVLAGALQVDDPRLRIVAARSVASLQTGAEGVPAVPGLVSLLMNGNELGKFWAAQAIGQIGQPAKSQLTPLLESHESNTAGFAAMAMAHISSRTAAPYFSRIIPLLVDESDGIRYSAFEAFRLIGPPARSGAGEVLDAARREKDAIQHSHAMEAVVAIDPDSPVTREALRRDLNDPTFVAGASWILGQKGESSAWAIEDLKRAAVSRAECASTGYPGLNPSAEALAKIGERSLPALVSMSQSSNECLQRIAARSLGEMGPKARESAPVLAQIAKSANPDTRREAVESLAKAAPNWNPKDAKPAARPRMTTSESEVAPDAQARDLLPFLIKELGSSDRRRRSEALEDLAYLGSAAAPAIASLKERSVKAGDEFERKSIESVLAQIDGRNSIMPRHTDRPPEPQLIDDVTIAQAIPTEPYRVGQPAVLDLVFRAANGRYWRPRGSAHRVLSAERLDADGRSHPVNIPVSTLYRGGFFGSWLSGLPARIDPDHPAHEQVDLNYTYILDTPGRYRFTLDALVAISTSAYSDWEESARFKMGKTKPIVAEIDLLPRDEAASGREFLELDSELKAMKDWEGGFGEQKLYWLIDYDLIPAILHVIEVSGNSSTTGTAAHALSYLCDRQRVRREVLHDIEDNKRPHSETEAHKLAEVLAATETIPCTQAASNSDLDYVRWDVARKKWTDRLLARMPVHP